MNFSRSEIEADIRLLDRRCRGPLREDAAADVLRLLHEGDLEAAALADTTGRTWCGYAVNDLICFELFDGKMHITPCPQCGAPLDWTPPLCEADVATPTPTEG